VGRLHLVPICFALDGDTVVSAVDAKPKRSAALQRFENVRANPEVALLVHHWDEDWSRLWWARLRGTARVVEGADAVAHAVELLAAKYAQYRDEPPHGPALAVALREWRGWSAAP
jgi:PPOX class probable F420-dependent enzyme